VSLHVLITVEFVMNVLAKDNFLFIYFFAEKSQVTETLP
jgi:hypothetical protein